MSEISESPFRGPTPIPMSNLREDHALREHSFINNTSAQLDDFLAQGRAVYDDLVDQRTMLKGTQRRLLDAANTLGLSRNVIGWIERRRYVKVDFDSDACSPLFCAQYSGHVYLPRWCRIHFRLFLLDLEVSGLIYSSTPLTRSLCIPHLFVFAIQDRTLLDV